MAIEVVGDVAVQASVDTALHPGFQDLLPVRVAKACPVFPHAADRVAAIGDRRTVGVLLHHLKRIGDRLRAELVFVPEVPVEVKETARPLFSVWFTDQELDIEVPDDLRSDPVNRSVLLFEPPAGFLQTLMRKVRRVTLVLRRVRLQKWPP